MKWPKNEEKITKNRKTTKIWTKSTRNYQKNHQKIIINREKWQKTQIMIKIITEITKKNHQKSLKFTQKIPENQQISPLITLNHDKVEKNQKT